MVVVRKLAVPIFILASMLSIAGLSCESAAGLPNPFATSTPTATATFTPTATPSPTPTSTPTATPLPTGMAIHNVSGGGSQYLDYDAGFIIDIPADWVAVKVDPEDLKASLALLMEQNPAMANALELAIKSGAGGFRIFGFDKNPEHYAEGYVPNFNVVITRDAMSISLPLDSLLVAYADQLKAGLQGASVRSLGIKTNLHGIEIGAVEIKLSLKLPDGSSINLYEKQLLFQTKKALVAITFGTPVTKVTATLPLFDKITDQIQLMEPVP